ncbi:MAG: hypothetical protein AB1679_34995 [Actinomycetota bacterium]|jgi:uncharacterized membrane protein YagU involved in acid resistance
MPPLQGFAGRRSEALERTLEKGVFFGVLASIPMGLCAMTASATYQGRGFFTPAYHVAFTIDPNTMGLSLGRAAIGDRFFMSQEAFVFGLAIHVMVAGVFGAVFALVATKFRLRGTQALTGGLIYGLVVMVLMSALVLPVAGAAFDAGDPISRMGSEIGWATFAALHALFGLALGTWLYVRPQDLEG